jgi:hypothetical protein
MLDAGSEITLTGVVENFEHPLLKLRDVPPAHMEVRNLQTNENVEDGVVRGPIINVGSSAFVSAILDDQSNTEAVPS